MQRFIHRYILALTVPILFAGCSKKFLELAPVSNANVASFYHTAADINNAVVAAYASHKKIYTNNFCTQSVLDEVRSDNSYLLGVDPCDQFIPDPGKQWWGWSWDQSYRAIYNDNIVIEKAPGVNMDSTLRNQYIAEVRFLRAITYFELVRNFGAVPVVTSTPTSLAASAVDVPRDSVGVVYAQIVADLQYAIAHLPAQYGSQDIGRATSGAAQGMLAKVYLTTGDKADAATLLRKIISSGAYQLLPTYAAVFDINNRNSAESLFELQFKAVTDGSPMENYFASQAATGIPGGGYGYNQATTDLVNAYEPGDTRKAVTLAVDGNGTWYTIKFNDPTMTSGFNSSHNFPILRYADVLLMLAEAIGESPEAYGYINQVRARAGLGPIDGTTAGTFSDKLLHERRVELAFENHRWHDLLRFGAAIPVMNAQLASQGIVIDQNDLLMPIPQTALNVNPKLTQNPGY